MVFFTKKDRDFTNAVAALPLPNPIIWLFFTSFNASWDNALMASSYVNYSTSAWFRADNAFSISSVIFEISSSSLSRLSLFDNTVSLWAFCSDFFTSKLGRIVSFLAPSDFFAVAEQEDTEETKDPQEEVAESAEEKQEEDTEETKETQEEVSESSEEKQ